MKRSFSPRSSLPQQVLQEIDHHRLVGFIVHLPGRHPVPAGFLFRQFGPNLQNEPSRRFPWRGPSSGEFCQALRMENLLNGGSRGLGRLAVDLKDGTVRRSLRMQTDPASAIEARSRSRSASHLELMLGSNVAVSPKTWLCNRLSTAE